MTTTPLHSTEDPVARTDRRRRTGAQDQAQEAAMITPGIDHIALQVPDLDAQVELLTTALGLVVEHRSGDFALVADPSTGLRLELGRSEDADVHFRHFGFLADDVDRAHQALVDTGMATTEEPHHRRVAGMYTSFLGQQGCAEVQLVERDRKAVADRG